MHTRRERQRRGTLHSPRTNAQRRIIKRKMPNRANRRNRNRRTSASRPIRLAQLTRHTNRRSARGISKSHYSRRRDQPIISLTRRRATTGIRQSIRHQNMYLNRLRTLRKRMQTIVNRFSRQKFRRRDRVSPKRRRRSRTMRNSLPRRRQPIFKRRLTSITLRRVTQDRTIVSPSDDLTYYLGHHTRTSPHSRGLKPANSTGPSATAEGPSKSVIVNDYNDQHTTNPGAALPRSTESGIS